MPILKIILYIIGGIITFFLLLAILLKVLSILTDQSAKRKGKLYCQERGYEFKKVEAYASHYGLFLSYQNMQIYASFYYEKDGTLTWKKGSPEEKINSRLNKRKG